MTAVTELILDNADGEDRDPMEMLESNPPKKNLNGTNPVPCQDF